MIGLLIKVLDFALPVLAMIFVGLAGTGVLVELGLIQKYSRLVNPIFACTNLPDMRFSLSLRFAASLQGKSQFSGLNWAFRLSYTQPQ